MMYLARFNCRSIYICLFSMYHVNHNLSKEHLMIKTPSQTMLLIFSRMTDGCLSISFFPSTLDDSN